VKGGATAGGTDGSSLCAVDEPIPIRDVHATLLNPLGLDDGHRTYPHAGRIRRWTDIRADVLKEIIISGVSAGSRGSHRRSERWPTRQEHGSAKSQFGNLGEAAIRRGFGSGCVSWRRGPRSRRWRWRSRGRGRGGGGGGGAAEVLGQKVAPPPSCRSCPVFAAARNPPWTSADGHLFACLAALGKRVPLMDLDAQPKRSAVEPLPGGLGRRMPLASPRRRRSSRPARTYRDGWRGSLARVFHPSRNGFREPGMDRRISHWHDAVSSALSDQTPRHLFIVPCFFPRRPAVSR